MTDTHRLVLEYIRARATLGGGPIAPKRLKDADELRHLKDWQINDAIKALKHSGYLKSSLYNRGLILIK